ncbi:MAG: CheR family methyltransferase [Rickettsiales bacterium]
MRHEVLKREFEFNHNDFEFISKLVKKNIGIVLGPHKKDMIYRRLSKRILELNLSSFKDYCLVLEQDNAELVNLANAISTNLTSFFREDHHFTHLEGYLLELTQRKKDVLMWSAGCSNGCEPYSMAMVASEVQLKNRFDYKILATDIDTNVIEKGRAGIYEAEWTEKIPARFKKYYKDADEHYIIDPKITARTHFRRLNLLDPWPMKKKYDVVFCRNTVIYFDKDTQAKLFDRIANQMVQDGILYIGHSENLQKVSDRYLPIGKTTYRRIK